MKTNLQLFLMVFLSMLFITCSSKSNSKNENKRKTYVNHHTHYDYSDDEDDEDDEDNEDSDEYDYGCKYEDGTYSATVDYYNPETGYSATYSLDVEIEDCQIVQINFPKGGWLDEDHIDSAEINEDGSATVYGEDGKTYEIQIDD
jgi:major membrane immunogen (membrane-anchored lipoprotein)